MAKMSFRCLMLGAAAALGAGCATEDIGQAHRGRLFARTGALALFQGGNGFQGQVLGPGTYYTGGYNQIRTVDCSLATTREPLAALTRDGVQFGISIYVRFSADCSDRSIQALLDTMGPDEKGDISSTRLYETFVKPAMAEAVRQTISPFRANDVNDQREEIVERVRKQFLTVMRSRGNQMVVVHEVNLSNLHFPDAMEAANVDRAVQGVLKDKAIAERERVQAEIQTMTLRRELAQSEGDVEATRIRSVGTALRQYPEYLQYNLQSKLPEIYRAAGIRGNMVLTAPNPFLMLNPREISSPSPPSPSTATTVVLSPPPHGAPGHRHHPGDESDNALVGGER